MRWLKTILLGAIALFTVILGILFTLHNTQTVAIDLVLIQLPEASLSVWLIAFFALGTLLGILLGLLGMLVLRTRLMRTRRRLDSAKKELDRLRTKALVPHA